MSSSRLLLSACCWLFVSASLSSAAPSPTPTPQTIFNRAVGSLAADPVRARVYATVPGDNTVIVVDTTSLTVTRTIQIGSIPGHLAISADRSKLWVANSGSTTFAVGVIDLTTLQALPSLSAPSLPYDIAEGASHRLYLSRSFEFAGGMEIDADTGVFLTSFGSFTAGRLDISPDRSLLYVGDQGTLIKYNVTTVTPSVAQQADGLGSNLQGLSVSHGGQFLVMPEGGGNGFPSYTTFEIPTANITSVNGYFDIGPYPGPAAFSNDDTLLYHGGYGGTNRITTFSTATFASLGTIYLAGNSDIQDVTIDRSGRWLFVAMADFQGNGDLRVIDTGRNDPFPGGTPLPTPTPGPSPTPTPTPTPVPTPTPLTVFNHAVARLAVDPVRSRVYATAPDDNAIIVVDTASLTVTSTIPIGLTPRGLSVSADGSKLWVANSGSTSAAVGVVDLNTLQVLPSIAAPRQPYDIEEGAGHRLYLTPLENSFPGGIMQIDADTGTYQTSFDGSVFIYNRGHLDVSPDRNTLFFGTNGSSPSTLARFNISTATASLIQQNGNLGSNGIALRVSNGGQFVVFPNGGGNGLGYATFEIPTGNLAAVDGTFVTDAYPGPAVFSNDDTLLYHSAYGPSRIVIFDTTTFVPVGTLLPGGLDIQDLAIDRSGHWLFVATADFNHNGDLRVFDTGRNDVVPTPTPIPGSLGNISTRLRVETGDNALIGGFIVTGAQPKKVIVRAIGPSLPVAGALADPTLELRDSSGALILSNDNWRSDQEADIIATTVAPSNDLESAIVATLPANNAGYTAIVRGVNSGTGIGLIEAYDLDPAANSKLGNISTRGLVQTNDNVLIAGTIVLGQQSKKVLVRAIGPSLSVAGKLADPVLELRDGNGALLRSNDNWRSDQEAEIIATMIPPTDDLEAAIVQTLPAGAAYTAIVRGVNSTTGVALVEVYALP